MKREHDKGIAEGERAVALDPGGAQVLYYYALILNFAGRPEEAIPLLQKAIRLNPFGSRFYFHQLGHAFLFTRRFEEAVSAYKKTLQSAPDDFYIHLMLAATYSMMGREEEARAEAAAVLRIKPKFSLDFYAKTSPLKDRSLIDNIVGALRKAGLK
jgi:tetratricopeptide (TPR) repeat protein